MENHLAYDPLPNGFWAQIPVPLLYQKTVLIPFWYPPQHPADHTHFQPLPHHPSLYLYPPQQPPYTLIPHYQQLPHPETVGNFLSTPTFQQAAWSNANHPQMAQESPPPPQTLTTDDAHLQYSGMIPSWDILAPTAIFSQPELFLTQQHVKDVISDLRLNPDIVCNLRRKYHSGGGDDSSGESFLPLSKKKENNVEGVVAHVLKALVRDPTAGAMDVLLDEIGIPEPHLTFAHKFLLLPDLKYWSLLIFLSIYFNVE